VVSTLVAIYVESTKRVVYLCVGATATDDTTPTETTATPEGVDDGRDSDEDHVQDVTEEGIEQESAAQVRYRQLTASGLYDVAEVPKMREGQDDTEGNAWLQ
jgi:ATP-dependent DNA ligase